MTEVEYIDIDGVEIMVRDGENWRWTNEGRYRRSCMFSNGTECTRIVHALNKNGGQFCNMHRFDTDPNSEERKKEELEKKMLRIEKIKKNAKKIIQTGNDTEQFVVDILKKLMKQYDDIEKVKRIGFSGSKYDIKIKFKGEDFYRAIQVKTLTKHHGNAYFFHIGSYEDDAIIVAVNKKKNKFMIVPFEKIKHNKGVLEISFKNQKCKFKEYKFTNIKKFEKRLYQASKQSVIYDKKKHMTKDQLNEYRSLKRLKKRAKELNLKFKLNEMNANIVDCFINKNKIQCKYTTYMQAYTYRCNIRKTVNKTPYEDTDDIDFFIFELHGEKNHFYIFPKQVLIDKGVIKTETQKGKVMIIIYPQNHPGDHWTQDYLNRFDLLLN